MKITKLSQTDRGGLKLNPPQFGHKLELVARGCGNFNDEDIVVAVAEVHDTMPDKPHKGVRFVRVRPLTATEREELANSGRHRLITDYRAVDVVDGKLVVETTTSLSLEWFGVNGALFLSKRREEIGKDDLQAIPRFGTPGAEPTIRLWVGSIRVPETVVQIEEELVGRILTEVLGYNIDAERAKIRSLQEESAAAAEKAMQRDKTLLATFLKEHPEAKEWFREEPTWHAVLQEAAKQRIARFVRSEKASHYASFSKEFDTYNNIYEITVGGERIQFVAGGRIEYEDGED